MNYSRHQLYALGEPIGESATHKSGGRIVYGSGGGGGPTSSTVTQSNIPDWLRPQVETTLGGSMQELFNTSPGQDGKLNITGVKPFVPYSQDPSDYVAGFSPMQEQAFGNIANLQVPGQFGTGTQMAQMAGQGALSVAPQAAGIASQQANAGNQYMGMASDPGSMRAFMSPYMQNVVNVQQQQAQRQADIANQAAKAGFAQRGAFGGGAQGIAQAQANADLMRTKQGIQATGLQNAFQNAQQAQQFGSNLGLQGMQGAQQGMQNVLGAYDLLGRQGANVGNLGTQQLAAQKDIIGLQSTAGGQQQQQQQNIVNQAIQNFANARQYPLQQYNAYNALLRGYAVPGQTATSYQAAPSGMSQLAGLGMGAYGISQMMGGGRAEGGVIKSMAGGGKVQSMATGGIPSLNRKVLFEPESVTLGQVQQGVKNETISDLIGIPAALQKQKMAQQFAAMQQQQPKQTIREEAMASGLPGLQSNLPEEMASGGIVAFSSGDLVREPTLSDQMEQIRAAKAAYGITGDATPESKAWLEAQRAAAITPEEKEQQRGMRFLQAGLGILGGTSPFALKNIAEGAAPALAGYAEDLKKQKESGLLGLKAQADYAEARRAEKLGDIKTAAELQEKALDRATRQNIAKDSQLGAKFADNYVQMKRSSGDQRSDEVIRDEGYRVFFKEYGYASGRVEATRDVARAAAGTAAAGQQSTAATAAAGQEVQRAEQQRKIVEDAADTWSKKKYIDPDLRRYRELAQGDPAEKDPVKRAADGRAAAEAFRDKWIQDEATRRTPKSSAAAAPAQPTAPARSMPAPGNYPKPTQAHIDHLKANPQFAARFDEKFGAGASAGFLPKPAQ